MNSPSYSSSGRGSQSGNPNVVFVFLACLALFMALVAYVWLKAPINGTLLAQLPPPAQTVSPSGETAGEAVTQVKTNPKGEALLEEVLAKPLQTAPTSTVTKDSVQKPADQQLVPANASTVKTGDTASANPMPADDAGAKVKTQFSGSTEYTYTVKGGETLYGIASRFKTPAASLRDMNALTDNSVQVGQAMKVKVQGVHKVRPSEGLAAIARTYGVTVAEIRKANGLLSDQLQMNQELVIPVQ